MKSFEAALMAQGVWQHEVDPTDAAADQGEQLFERITGRRFAPAL